jgi:hypothetical protein
MSGKYILTDVHPKLYFLGAYVVFELAADGQEPAVVAADCLVLQETLLEGMALFVGTTVLMQHA